MPIPQSNRRDFLKTTAAAGTLAAMGFHSSLPAAEPTSPSERVNVACIGVAGRGGANVDGVASQNIVAICDVDGERLEGAGKRFPKAARHQDFRRLLDKEQKGIDAVVVSTPDHIHAPASIWAMKLGKHCYCEKPLAHNVFEVRQMTRLARENKLATQMGTQIHAGDNYRRVVEVLQSGAIGAVTEVHVWVGKNWGGGERPEKADPVPANLDWDLWLGPAPERPFAAGVYHPANWRRWWDFGNGTLGDMACHYMDLPFWALDIAAPRTVTAEGPPVHAETCPTELIVRYEFPGTGEKSGCGSGKEPVRLTWYDGERTPKEVAGHKVGGAGVMFVGSKGQMFADYGSYRLYPESEFAGYEPPPRSIPDSIGHHAEWLKAVKEGGATTCNFSYSGALAEAVLLGAVAYRSGETIEWNAESLQAKGSPGAEQFLKRKYRQGWEL